MLQPGFQDLGGEGVAAQEGLEQGDVAEVAEQGSVDREEQLLGVVGPQPSRGHLHLEEGDGPCEQGPQPRAQVGPEAAGVLEGLAPHQADELGVGHEEPETQR